MEENYYGFDYWRAGQTLAHHGIKGQKWGVRRFQNPDGSLTDKGRKRYGSGSAFVVNKPPKDILADAIAVNGGKKGNKYGYNRQKNCVFCSIAYDMRRRGYDVRAQEAINGVIDNVIKKAYSGKIKSTIECKRSEDPILRAKGMTSEEFQTMHDNIVKDGDNTSGEVTLSWKASAPNRPINGGHSLRYEVKNGDLYFVDPQIGEVMSGKKAYDYFKNAIDIEHYRTDNLKLAKNAEKYYTESADNVIRINKAAKVSDISNKIANGMTGIGTGSYAVTLGSLAAGSPEAAFASLGVFAGATILSVPMRIVSVTTALKAGANANKEAEKLAEKWTQEGRRNYYTTDPNSKKKAPKSQIRY